MIFLPDYKIATPVIESERALRELNAHFVRHPTGAAIIVEVEGDSAKDRLIYVNVFVRSETRTTVRIGSRECDLQPGIVGFFFPISITEDKKHPLPEVFEVFLGGVRYTARWVDIVPNLSHKCSEYFPLTQQ